MKRWVNIASQIVLGMGQLTNLATPLLDEKSKIVVAIGLGFLTLVVSSIAHEYNPDGTSAHAAYTPDNTRS